MTDQIDAPEADDDVLLSDDQTAEDQIDTEAAAEEGEQAEEQQPAPKPKKTAQERINEVTRKAREAERERDYWRDAAMSGQPQRPAHHPAPVHPRDEAPHPDDFTYGDADPNYLVALAEHRAVERVTRQFEAREQSQRQTTQLSAFEQKTAQLFPDGEPEGIAALRDMPRVRQEITDVIFTSDKGPLIAEHLGDNPSVLNRLNGLAPHLVGFELARIEAALSAPAAPPVNRVTKAPDPAPKARGSGGQFAVTPDTTDFAAFERLAAKAAKS